MEGFQKPRSQPTTKQGLAVVRDGYDERGRAEVTCSCGWATSHTREKVRLDRAERHVERRHASRAIFL